MSSVNENKFDPYHYYWAQRRRFLRRLRIARVTPKELMDKLTAGETISIVDLR